LEREPGNPERVFDEFMERQEQDLAVRIPAVLNELEGNMGVKV
jgi:hypothetical protein